MEKIIILLRGVTPTGQNRIPKMAYLREILETVGLQAVEIYIQSGNIVCETDLADKDVKNLVHDTILEKIGADLSVIIKSPEQLMAAQENPFDDGYDSSRVHLVFTNDTLPSEKVAQLLEQDFDDELFAVGSECLYLYLPRDAEKKRLNTNFLEKKMAIKATMRKLSVTKRLSQL
ncbi:DUF1697 domain-containing protein [Streptococcus tangpeifui]|uniref:DUF1697 domain-containing protein n=1 Tax=Streptococcus tangpeifui TaxID=2709400 RepID=UPI0013EA3C0E|nr:MULTISPECIES: DUF1697 domain-containing protein [unclassified Streptococcus]